MFAFEFVSCSLAKGADPFSWAAAAGSSWAVMGRAGSGKSLVLETLAGRARPVSGSVQRSLPIAIASQDFNRRATVQRTAMDLLGRDDTGLVAEVLTALDLWEVRRSIIDRLSPARQSAIAILPLFCPGPAILICDGWLDRLGPWALGPAMELLLPRLAQGSVLVVATDRPDIAQKLGSLVVMRELGVGFAGGWLELEHRMGQVDSIVVTGDPERIAAAADALELTAKILPGGEVLIAAAPGQDVAVRLLLEGYGAVRTVISRPPTTEELLLAAESRMSAKH